ncbi:MAG: esterase family protein [Lachnospiraceae bacterium]|nr:esterase family protein [Lachnospiraceae bacterium]
MSFSYETPQGFDEASKANEGWIRETVSYPSNTTGADRLCHVILPAGYSKEKTYPVFYLLHGIGGDHNEWLGGNPLEVISNLVGAGEATEMIVVIPNVRAMKEDAVPQEVFGPVNIAAFDNFINDLRDDLMPFIKANYSIKTDRENTAIAGLSMGGRESLFIGFTMPETFGYIGAFSPAPGLLPLTFPDAGNRPAFPGQFTEDDLRVKEGKPAPLFLMMCNGEQDEIVKFCTAGYEAALNKNGVEHLYYTMPGGHDFGVWRNGLYHFAKRIFK